MTDPFKQGATGGLILSVLGIWIYALAMVKLGHPKWSFNLWADTAWMLVATVGAGSINAWVAGRRKK